LQQQVGNRATGQLLTDVLAPEVVAELRARLHAPLDGVRVHTGEEGARRAREEQAAAVTRGSDIYFGPGVFRPGTAGGRAVLSHELAHTVQQTRTGLPRSPDPARCEAAADRAALHGGPLTEGAPAGAAQCIDDERLKELQERAEAAGNASDQLPEKRVPFANDPDFAQDLTESPPEHEEAVRQSFGEEAAQREAGGQVTASRNPPGSRAEPKPAATGRFIHSWVQAIMRRRLTNSSAAGAPATDLITLLELNWPAHVQPNEGPDRLVIELHDGKTYIPDGVDFDKGIIYELKPQRLLAAAEAQAQKYCLYMDQHFPLPNGRKWQAEPVGYNSEAALGWLERIGFLPPRNKGPAGVETPTAGRGATGGGRLGKLFGNGGGSSLVQFGAGVLESALRQKAIQREVQQKGIVPVGPAAFADESLFGRLARFFIDPTMESQADPLARFDVRIWRERIRAEVGAASGQGTYELTYTLIGKDSTGGPGPQFTLQTTEEVTVTYERDASGAWRPRVPDGGRVDRKGTVRFRQQDRAIPDLNQILDPAHPDGAVLETLFPGYAVARLHEEEDRRRRLWGLPPDQWF
jgi:hypothetical protein